MCFFGKECHFMKSGKKTIIMKDSSKSFGTTYACCVCLKEKTDDVGYANSTGWFTKDGTPEYEYPPLNKDVQSGLDRVLAEGLKTGSVDQEGYLIKQ